MTEIIAGAHQSDTHQKALRINLDPRWYGTIAEIGAGQEVVRWFFRVGGAAGTVAKSISAYDMAVSDAEYGKADRYVSMGRLQGMLDKEFQLNVERLNEERGDSNCFFAFADTVVARSFRGGNECHGWMGVKFQAEVREENMIVGVRNQKTRARSPGSEVHGPKSKAGKENALIPTPDFRLLTPGSCLLTSDSLFPPNVSPRRSPCEADGCDCGRRERRSLSHGGKRSPSRHWGRRL